MNAQSTIAMSAVSQLALTGPLDSPTLRDTLSSLGFEVSQDELNAALDEAVRRCRIYRDGERFISALPPGHVVVARDPANPSGWAGWGVRRPDDPKNSNVVTPFTVFATGAY